MKLKVLQNKEEVNNCFSLILEKPAGFSFYPGQFWDVELRVKVSDGRGKVRAFTIASSPTEDFLMITSKKGISDFKVFMQNLKPGDFIDVSHPAGTFILDESEPAVFITGGIGVTPFRSMIKYVFDNNIKTPIILLYANSNDNFLFKQELNEWQKQLPNLEIIYIETNHEGRIDKNKLALIINRKSLIVNHIYYLAGSQSMIYNFSKDLEELGVDEVSIRTDSFDGYE